jgi:hypothetical protein
MTALVGIVALQAEIMQLIQGVETGDTDKLSSAAPDILRQRLARAAAVGYQLDKFLNLS